MNENQNPKVMNKIKINEFNKKPDPMTIIYKINKIPLWKRMKLKRTTLKVKEND